MVEIKEPLFYNTCASCGVGRGENTRKMILRQMEKHGEFICPDCESFFEEWLLNDSQLTYEGLETFVTTDTIYHKDHGRALVCDPKSSFLGFGGAWLLISKRYENEWGVYVKHFVANNLFHYRRIPLAYQQKVTLFKKVDSKVQFTNLKGLKDLREQLNSLTYLDEQ